MGLKVSEWLLKTNVPDLLTKVSAAYEKVNQVTERATAAWDKLNSGGRKTVTTMGELEARINALHLERKAAVTTDEIQRLNTELLLTERELRRLDGLPPKSLLDRIKLGTGLFGEMAGMVGGAFSIYDVQSFGKEVLDTTAKYQKFIAVLANTQGKPKAVESMEMISNFASKTPFQVSEITDAYIKLVNRGMTPTEEALTKYGDLASATGKDFMQLTEAVLDATTGEFERLKEFGIRGSKSGDQVTLAFKGMNQTVANTPEAINAALLAFGSMQGVAGSMDAISQTLVGKMSNIQDRFDQFLAGIGAVFQEGMSGAMDFIGLALDKLMVMADWMYANRAGVGLFFKILGAGALVLAALALQAWLVTLPFNIWIVGIMAVGAALAFAYQKIGFVRGAIDALIEIVKMSVEQWILYWRIVYNIWEGLYKMFEGDFSFSGLEKALEDQVKLFSEAGSRARNAYVTGFNQEHDDEYAKQESLSARLAKGVPDLANPNSFVAGSSGSDAASNSSVSQSVTNITNQDQGQKSYVIQITNLYGIGNYVDNSGKGQRAAQRSGEFTMDELTRVLNGANLAVQ